MIKVFVYFDKILKKIVRLLLMKTIENDENNERRTSLAFTVVSFYLFLLSLLTSY